MIETASVLLGEAYVQAHSIVPPGDYVRLTVTDSGEGIASEHLSHIFEPFYTSKEEGKGTGLGLATVYGIVKQNSGFIWVYSEPGLGTTFKIYLPRARDARVVPQPVLAVDAYLGAAKHCCWRKTRRRSASPPASSLSLKGYIVLEVKNGTDALAIAREYTGPIHLMVTGVVMPQMGRARLAGELAVERPDMKVLFVSGYAETTVQRHGAIDATTSFLQKPFSLKTLANKIRALLDTDAPALAAAASASSDRETAEFRTSSSFAPSAKSPSLQRSPCLSYNCFPES